MNDTTTCCTSKSHKVFAIIVLAIIIAGGNLICGWFVAKGLWRFKMDDRYVSAKGLSQRDVTADLAWWDINYTNSGDDLQQVNTKTINDQKIITTFLTAHGFSADEIDIGQTTVIDQYANEYRQNNKPEPRFIINNIVKVRSTKVDLVKQTSKLTTDLITQGVILNNKDSNNPNPRYLYTKLDNIRPGMLEEATRSARLAADQFAINSGSKLGKIKHASQGVFQILSTDTSNNQQNYSQEMEQEGSVNKTVRVVSSIDYFLEQ